MKKIIILFVLIACGVSAFSQCLVCHPNTCADLTYVPNTGTPPYTYIWAPGGETTATINVCAAGTYTVTVTDNNSCTAVYAETITISPEIVVTCAKTDNTTCSPCNGTVTATATGGVGPLTYNWEDSGGTSVGTTLTVNALCGETYTFTATDANGCTATCQVTITDNVTVPTGSISCTPV